MNFVRLLPVIFSFLMLSAHFSRAGNIVLSVIFLLIPVLLFFRKKWVARTLQVLLIFGAIIWVKTTLNYVHIRQAMGEPWVRLVVILGLVALFTAASTLVFENKKIKKRYHL